MFHVHLSSHLPRSRTLRAPRHLFSSFPVYIPTVHHPLSLSLPLRPSSAYLTISPITHSETANMRASTINFAIALFVLLLISQVAFCHHEDNGFKAVVKTFVSTVYSREQPYFPSISISTSTSTLAPPSTPTSTSSSSSTSASASRTLMKCADIPKPTISDNLDDAKAQLFDQLLCFRVSSIGPTA